MSGGAEGAEPVRIYGIRNCDTMKKAFAWLDDHGITYDFHDYKKKRIESERLSAWCAKVDWERLLNRRGTTWRKLSEEERADVDVDRAIALMVKYPSMIKRPVLEVGDDLIVGFDAGQYAQRLQGG